MRRKVSPKKKNVIDGASWFYAWFDAYIHLSLIFTVLMHSKPAHNFVNNKVFKIFRINEGGFT